MMLAVLLTLMTGKMHDGTPSRDGNYGQEAKEEGEEEEMEDQESGTKYGPRKRMERRRPF